MIKVRVNLDGEESEGVTRYLNHVISRSGDPIVQMTSRQSSKVISIQGEWIPPFRSTNSIPTTPIATKYFMKSRME